MKEVTKIEFGENLLSPNVLFRIYESMTAIISDYKMKVCQECSFSAPTYYRKLKTNDRDGADDLIKHGFSNAEKEKCIAVLDEVLEGFCQHFEDYGLKLNKRNE